MKPEDLWLEHLTQSAKVIPDSRPKDPWLRSKREVTDRNGQRAERVFCASCGTDAGAVTIDWAPYIVAICDRCAETLGPLPLPELPDDLLIRPQ